jgi:hypothetical protein
MSRSVGNDCVFAEHVNFFVTSQNFTNFGMSNENKILCLIVDLIDIRKELKLFVVIKMVFLK